MADDLAPVELYGLEDYRVEVGEVACHRLLIIMMVPRGALDGGEEEDDEVADPAMRRRCHRRVDWCSQVAGLAEDLFGEPTKRRRRLYAESSRSMRRTCW